MGYGIYVETAGALFLKVNRGVEAEYFKMHMSLESLRLNGTFNKSLYVTMLYNERSIKHKYNLN